MVGWEGMKWAGGNRKGKDDKDAGRTKKDKVLGYSCWEKNKALRNVLCCRRCCLL